MPSRTSPATATTTAAATAAAGCGSAPWTSASAGVRQLLPDQRRPLGAAPVRRHHGAELDRVLAGRPHALFRRHAAACDLGVRFQSPCRHDRRPPACSPTSRRARPSRRLLRRCRGLSLERRIRRPPPDPLRAGRPPRPHHRTAGDQPDLLLLRRRRPRHALCHQRHAGAQARRPGAMEGGLLALDVGVRGLPEAAFGG